MRAKERIEKGVRQIQLLLPAEQHRRLKIRAAMDGVTITDLLSSRIADIIEPIQASEASQMAAPR